MTRFASKSAEDEAVALGIADLEIEGTGSEGKVTVEDVRAAGPPPPPEDLGEAGERFWLQITTELELEFRPDELVVLRAACACLDEITAMEAALADGDTMVSGSQGQPRPNPLLAEVRSHRLALRQLLTSIGITDVEDGADRGAERSAAGRKLARQRWSNRG
jgi:hypothetical protein